MCGITGLFSTNNNNIEKNIGNMVNVLEHRGPNDNGVWINDSKNIALGHARLSILDLSSSGHQPMHSSSNRWVIAYNGEVYNFKELREKLIKSGRIFKSESDTEVILESIDLFGVEKTVNQLVGMFAFSAWDKQEKKLYLVRDRLGIKPLYWGHFGDFFLFGSELRALRECKDWRPEIDRNSLANYFRHNYIPAPHSIYKNVFKLLPGHILTYKIGEEPKIRPFWSLSENEVKSSGLESESKILDSLHNLLSDSIIKRMMADVPLGAFLSGGIDSSTVAAIMQANSSKPINTFTIGFNEEGYNEAKHALAISKHLGTNHAELYVSSQKAMDTIPLMPDIYDEPFSDSSQIPTYLVSKMAREHVTVSLSGDGGDECFAGYSRYFLANRMQKYQWFLPDLFKTLSSKGIQSFSPSTLDYFAKLLPEKLRPSQFGHRLHKFANILNEDEDGFYRRLISHWDNNNELVLNGEEYKGLVWDKKLQHKIPNFIERMCYIDMMTYLPDDILTKVDRASMAVSLEARVPLLDHRVVEFSRKIPLHMKIRDGQGKWALRQVLYKYVPKELVERPKMGFGVPIDKWLRGPLREWAEDLLEENKIQQQGLLNYNLIKEKWDEHLSGKRNWQYLIWDVLMFQAWHEKWM